jgi:sugar phosphate isomerase/epimerase
MAAQRSGGLRAGCQTNAWRINPKDFEQFLAILQHVRSLGFQGFETSFLNLQGQFSNAQAARKRIEQTGLVISGVHIFLPKFDPDTALPPMSLIQQVADGAARLGAERVILSGRGLMEEGKIEATAISRKTAALNAAGEYCRKRRLRVAYHNHGAEFGAGGAEIEALIEKTQPGLVDLFPDAGYIFHAKADVTQFFARHHARITGFHFRDFKGRDQVPLGQGEFDLRPLAAAMRRLKWSGWVLNEEERENDGRPGDAAMVPAREHLKKIFGV